MDLKLLALTACILISDACAQDNQDKGRNEVISMKVYTSRNYLTSKFFIKETLALCDKIPRFIVDKSPWLKDALDSLNLEYKHEIFGRRSLVESIFSSFKQRVTIFFCSINSLNPVKCWNL